MRTWLRTTVSAGTALATLALAPAVPPSVAHSFDLASDQASDQASDHASDPAAGQSSGQSSGRAARQGAVAGLWPTGFAAGTGDCGPWRLNEQGFCVADDARNGLEVGLRFATTERVQILGIRIYRVDRSALRATLWDGAGSVLARGEFPAGDAGGWQDLAFDEPVEISPGQTYTASYFTPQTKYAFEYGTFSAGAWSIGPITALRSTDRSPNGVFCYRDAACGEFPVRGHRHANYWVTPLWRAAEGAPGTPGNPGTPGTPGTPGNPGNPGPGSADRTAPRVASSTPTRGARGVPVGAKVRVRLSERVQPRQVSTTTFTLTRRGTTKAVRARVSYDAQRREAVLHPGSPLTRSSSYRVVVSPGVKDLAGNRLDQNPTRPGAQGAVWTFRTR